MTKLPVPRPIHSGHEIPTATSSRFPAPSPSSLSTPRSKRNAHSPGLHHLAFGAPTREDVDRVHRDLVALGVKILDPPVQYDEYGIGYYAVFFADPDGIKLEYVYTP